ncbi:hypothetical protein G6F61_014979 [Rhizopus arrhizus]|nr:hypothetical protein G6F61_014979 [Rhizopus arrhizus]
MFAGAGAVRGDRAAHQVVVDRFGLFPFLRILGIQQHQHVEVAVADVAEADDADAGHQRLKPCAGAAALPARARATPRGRAPGGQTQRSPRR